MKYNAIIIKKIGCYCFINDHISDKILFNYPITILYTQILLIRRGWTAKTGAERREGASWETGWEMGEGVGRWEMGDSGVGEKIV